ncbi:MAG TPA: hypothetical protein VM791_08470 [Vicinamibacterales bacterium]|jgi:hypothetical protein|nr:hypothetical protein [Vicinamibacterales bacterium]
MDNPPAELKDPGLRLLGRLAASVVLWLVTFAAANMILARDPPSAAVRAGAVAAAIGGLLPWIWMASRAITMQDEYNRRIHLIALAWAFAATGVFIIAAHLLSRAHFIDYLPLMDIVLLMVLAWWVSIVLTSRHYR